jgi:hypothetical protein
VHREHHKAVMLRNLYSDLAQMECFAALLLIVTNFGSICAVYRTPSSNVPWLNRKSSDSGVFRCTFES